MDFIQKINNTLTLDIYIPYCNQYSALRYTLNTLADYACCQKKFLLPSSDKNIFILNYGKKTVSIPFQINSAEQANLSFSETGLKLWANSEKIIATHIDEYHINLNCDVITPISSLLSLQEETIDPHRDVYGLVEGRRSKRFGSQTLMTPFFDNLALYLTDLLQIECSIKRPSLSIAVSCDIDFIDDDHLPQVLQFFAEHNIHRPTFYLYGGGDEGKSKYDPSYNIKNRVVANRLEILKKCEVEIGLHGGFLTHDKLERLLEEKDHVEQWLGQPIFGHRAHFFRFAYPRSWKVQQHAGFIYDCSLGYPDTYGIRNACSQPLLMDDAFPFYIMPTMILDQHFFWPKTIDEQQIKTIITSILDEISAVNGMLVLDWHTYTLNTIGFEGWWEPLHIILEEARSRKAYLAGTQAVLKALVTKNLYSNACCV